MSNRRSITKAKHRRPSAAVRHGQRAVVVTVTGGLAAGGFVAGAGSAMADHTTVSQAEGYFLSGNVAGISLNDLLPTATAVNKSHDTGSVVNSPNNGDLLNLSNTISNVPLTGVAGVNLLGNNGILDIGALRQYATAKGNGSSIGASGAVTDSGAISASPIQNATLDLSNLLGGVVGTVADLNVEIGALAATATKTAGSAAVGDYKIADLVVNLQSPALATVLGTLNTALTTANTTLGGLGALGAVTAILPVGTTLTNVPNLTSALTTFNSTLNSEAGGISVNPATGAIAINVSSLVNLNGLAPNTDLIPYILGALDNVVSGALTTLTSSVTGQLGQTIGTSVPLGILPQGLLDTLLPTLLTPVTTAVTGALTGAGTGQASLLDAGTGGLIGSILNGVLDLVANVQQTVAGVFTERALSVGLSLPVGLGGLQTDAVADGTLALVNLASAAVGPNAGPAVTALAPPVITEPDDGDTTTDRTPQIEGTGVAGATVTVKEGSNTLCTAVVAADKTWKCNSENLSLGSHTIVATQKLAGVTSDDSNKVTFKILAADYDDNTSTALPHTGGNGSTPLVAAAGLGLLLGGMGLTALPGGVGRHGGAGSSGGGSRARGGRHAKR